MVRRGGLAALLFLGSSSAAWAAAPECAQRLTPPHANSGSEQAVTAASLIELRDFGPGYSAVGGDQVLSLSPDGTRAVIALRRADIATNSYCLGVMVISLDTGAARLIDVGGAPMIGRYDLRGFADMPSGVIESPPPRWSPDGRTLAYLRRNGGVTQIWRADPAGGAAPVTHETVDVRSFVWSADGRSLIYSVRTGLVEQRAAIEREGNDGFHYDRRFWPIDGNRPLPSANSSLEMRAVTLETGHTRRATDAEKRLLQTPPDPGFPTDASLHTAGKAGALAWVRPRFSDRFQGPSKLEARIGGKTFTCDTSACDDRVIGLWWQSDGALLFLRDWTDQQQGKLEFFRWRPGSPPVSLYATSDLLSGCLPRRDTLICGRESATQPRQLVEIIPQARSTRTLFDPNPEWKRFRLGSVNMLAVQASDGAPAYAALVLPPDHKPGEKHPLIIVQYNNRGFLRGGTGDDYPIYYLAARGYAVLAYQRPQAFAYGSSAGDLNAYARLSRQDWADRRRAFTAMDAAVDAALAGGAIDAGKIGITGLSEGVGTVQWALLHSERYRAAAISSCCEDPASSAYMTGPAYLADTQEWGDPRPGDIDPAFWGPYSLAVNAARIDVPILGQLPDNEFRYALETFTRLRDHGKPIEIYVFPDEYHVKWQPRHRLAVYERGVDWFDFWLRGREDPASAKAGQYQRWRTLRAEFEQASQD